jgi:hypothetical protein
MSSSFSQNLALELMGTGDQAGLWGVTTNTNLGTLLDQAIAGYTTTAMTTDADTTITIPDGATGQARNMYIEIPSSLTLTANRTLTVPTSKSKLYFVYNNSSGGYAVTVKTTAGAGISVANGTKQLLVCNGTDVYIGINTLNTGSFSITESGGYLYIYYGTTKIGRMDSSGNLSIIGSITSGATI